MWQSCRYSKEERWVLGVGIDHVRRHVISQRNDEGHVIHHVTCLGASEDYTSRRDLESSKIQHVISKMFRDERRIATKSTIARGIFSEGKLHTFKVVTIACIAQIERA